MARTSLSELSVTLHSPEPVDLEEGPSTETSLESPNTGSSASEVEQQVAAGVDLDVAQGTR